MDHQLRPDRPPTVLLVADPAGRAAEHAAWLEDRCEPIVAHGVEEVRDAVTDRVDVAVIDSPVADDALTDAIREGAPDCSLLLLSGESRTLDPAGSPFDELLPTPTTRTAILETVARLYRLSLYWGQCRADFAIASRLAELAADHGPAVAESGEYRELRHRLVAVRDAISETSRGFETRDVARAYAHIDRLGVPGPA